MKDSRVGTYAVVGLILLLLLKVSLLVRIIQQPDNLLYLLLVVINGHTLSRLMAASVIFTHEYVREDESSKVRPVAKSYSAVNVIIAVVTGIMPTVLLAIFFQQWWGLLIPVVLYLVKGYLANYFRRKIGGYTGDCLGATQQLIEVVYYLTVVILWNYI
jgi:adenosylcobinamide-GDP ribazoletransferase